MAVKYLEEDFIIYKLRDESLKDAKKLETIVDGEMAASELINDSDDTPQSLHEAAKTSRLLQESIYERLKKNDFYLLHQTNLTEPVTQIEQEKSGEPRTYKKYNKIYSTGGDPSDYYMFCPVDHRGEHKAPTHGDRLYGRQKENVLRNLFAGGWVGNAPILDIQDKGVSLPYDFHTLKDRPPYPTGGLYIAKKPGRIESFKRLKVFGAHGKSLQAVQDFKNRETAYKTAVSSLLHFVDLLLADFLTDENGKTIAYTNKQLKNEKGKAPEIWVSLRDKGATNPMSAGQPLPLKETENYKIAAVNGHDVKITPNTDTLHGNALQVLLDTLPEKPELDSVKLLKNPHPPKEIKGYFNYFGRDWATPQVYDVGNDTFLLYTVARKDPNNEKLSPPDAIPVSTALFLWLEQDRIDHQLGRLPPPMPFELENELEELHKKGFGNGGYNRFLPPNFGL